MSDWYEIVIEATEEAVEALLAETGTGSRVIRGADLDLEPESFAERIRDLLGARSHHLLFAHSGPARELLRGIEEHPSLRLEGVRQVTGGRFSFRAKAFSPEVAREIRGALLTSLPPGVTIEGLEERERENPEAKGVELYSPAHDYVYRARGTMAGPFPEVAEMHRRSRNLAFVHEEPLRIEARAVDPSSLSAPSSQS